MWILPALDDAEGNESEPSCTETPDGAYQICGPSTS